MKVKYQRCTIGKATSYMKKRTFLFNGEAGAAKALVNVIQHYAHAAYPVGGSDCAATTRQALLELAEKVEAEVNIDISTRQRPMLKSAIEWFYTESGKTDDPLFITLKSQFEHKK